MKLIIASIKINILTVFFAALVACAVARLIAPIVQQSATYDEPYKIGASYVMAKEGYFYYDPTNPPLYKYCFSIPLFLLHPDIVRPNAHQMGASPRYFKSEFAFGYRFLFYNAISAHKLLVSTRFVSLLIYVAGGIFFFWYLRRRYSGKGALFGASLYFLCPNLAAASVLATNDIFGAVFAMFFVAGMLEFLDRPSYTAALITGVLMGAAISAKFSLFILPVFYCVTAILLVARKKLSFINALIYSAAVFGCAIFIVELSYRFMNPSSIIAMIRSIYTMVSHGLAAYAAGNYSREGFAYFYPLAFLLKTPIPVLILLLCTGYIFISEKKYLNDRCAILGLCLAIFSFAAIKVRLDLGLRYILPAYPMAYMFVVMVMDGEEMLLRKYGPLIVILLSVSNVIAYPHYQAYFNLLIGKNENAYKYFVDSSLDWGQDLGLLAQFLKSEGDPEVMLSYFGSASPASCGISCQDLCSDGLDQAEDENRLLHINSDNPRKEFLAVSATCRVGLDYPNHHWFDFLRERKPIKVIGNTIFVYDISGDVSAYKSIAQIYIESGRKIHALRCGRVVAGIDPVDSFGQNAVAVSNKMYKSYYELGSRYEKMKDYEKAQKAYFIASQLKGSQK